MSGAMRYYHDNKICTIVFSDGHTVIHEIKKYEMFYDLIHSYEKETDEKKKKEIESILRLVIYRI